MDTVLVTGASGFIAQHLVVQLLQQGYRVRGTLRSLDRAAHQRTVIGRHADAGERLVYVEADLLRDEGWDEAMRGCRYVLHTASPFPGAMPKDENELIRPAREGTLRVLGAAARAGIPRVVLTSSVVAISGGHAPSKDRLLDERYWTRIEAADAYSKSKTLAERAAWDFVNGLPAGKSMELAVINPTYVQGPILDEEFNGTSRELLERLLGGSAPGCVSLNFGIVDVRDVATAHLAAMTTPEAAGKRFCCSAGNLWMREVALILDQHFSARGYRIPTNKLPDFMVHLFGLFDPTVRNTARGLGKVYAYDTRQIVQVLGWDPFPMETTIIEMAESMIELGMVKAAG